MNRKAFVLLSGGLDSTTALYKAMKDFYPPDRTNGGEVGYDNWFEDRYDEAAARFSEDAPTDILEQWSIPDCDWVEAVSVDYGQRHKKELEYAARTCAMYGIKHTILDVGNLLGGKTVMLSAESKDTVSVPDISYDDIKGVSPTYVPFRNGLLLSAITAHAQKYVNEQIANEEVRRGSKIPKIPQIPKHMLNQIKENVTRDAKDLCGVYFGAHSEDAANWAYPDCTPEFIGAMANAIYIGSYQTIRLHTPLQWLMKDEIVDLGENLGVAYEHTWSCYKGEEKHCGVCPTCRSRKQAFEKAHVEDPTDYAA